MSDQLNHTFWNDIQLAQYPWVQYIKLRDRLLHRNHNNMKSYVFGCSLTISGAPQSITTSGNSIMLILPGLVTVLRVNVPASRYMLFNSKQAMVCSLSLQAWVQMSNTSSSNPIWYDNSK